MASAPAPATVVVVTGATAGLGLHCVRALLGREAGAPDYVVLACRNTSAAATVADGIAADLGVDRARLVVLPQPCDLADLASVRAYAAALHQWLTAAPEPALPKELIALVNNAGISAQPTVTHTIDGVELIFASNHLGHFLLTLLLLPAITRRIVNVASEVHDPRTASFIPDVAPLWPTTEDTYDRILARGECVAGGGGAGGGTAHGMQRYALSKLANVLFTFELARRLTGAVPAGQTDEAARAAYATLPSAASVALPQAAQLKVVAFNPGLMLDSNFIRIRAVAFLTWLLEPLLSLIPMVRRLKRSAPMSGANLADLALGVIAPETTAAYLSDRGVVPSSEFSVSAEGARAQAGLWEHSLRWARLTPAELQAAGISA